VPFPIPKSRDGVIKHYRFLVNPTSEKTEKDIFFQRVRNTKTPTDTATKLHFTPYILTMCFFVEMVAIISNYI